MLLFPVNAFFIYKLFISYQTLQILSRYFLFTIVIVVFMPFRLHFFHRAVTKETGPSKATEAKTTGAEAAESAIMLSTARAYGMHVGFIFATAFGTNLYQHTTANFVYFIFFIKFADTFWWSASMLHRSVVKALH